MNFVTFVMFVINKKTWHSSSSVDFQAMDMKQSAKEPQIISPTAHRIAMKNEFTYSEKLSFCDLKKPIFVITQNLRFARATEILLFEN